MKKIKIPLIEKEIRIYVGEKEWAAWRNACIKNECPEDVLPLEMPSDDGDGLACLGYIWLYSKNSINTIFHELQHSFSVIFDYLGCENEEELKAHIVGYVCNEAYKWIQEND